MLTIYRRHRKDCKHTSRRFKRCACPIHVEGSLRGEKIRKALDLTSWEAASDRIAEWNASGEIGGVRIEIPTIEGAVDKHLADARARNLKPESLKKIRDVIERRFLDFCKRKGVRALRQVSVDIVRDFRNELADEYAPNSAKKRLEYVHAFFRFVHNSGWTTANPSISVKAPRGDRTPTLPFEEEEVERMLAAAETFTAKGKFKDGNRRRVKAMILLLRYSGLRISDASVLSCASLKGDTLKVRTIKNQTDVWLPLPRHVVDALHESPNDDPCYFFWNGRCRPTSAVKIWEHTMSTLFKKARVTGGTIHRMRDTFSVRLLEKGVPVETVAAILGNTPAIVLKHYAPWVESRQRSLEAAVRKAW